MIRNDTDLQTTQERILMFERVLAEARKNYSPSNYKAMAEGYLVELARMQDEIHEYLSEAVEQAEAA